jgi:hypothetical protein
MLVLKMVGNATVDVVMEGRSGREEDMAVTYAEERVVKEDCE